MKISSQELLELWTHFNTNMTTKEVIINKEKQKKYNTTLVVGDAHTAPGQDLSRFTALGRYANEVRPDEIVFMGDFANFDSLSSYDRGKEASHGKKYRDEIKTARHALKLFLDELEYNPNLIYLNGNHEHRIEAYIENNAMLRGHMDIKEDLRLDELGFKFVPYKKYYEDKNGVLYSHAVINAAGTAVSGKNALNLIGNMTAKSIVVGHVHRCEYVSIQKVGAEKVQQILFCGLFSQHTDAYAEDALNSYSRCICLLKHMPSGLFDLQQVSLEYLLAEYN